jgi:hypothetical protein
MLEYLPSNLTRPLPISLDHITSPTIPSLAHTTIELHSKWMFTSSTSAPVPTSRTTPSPGAMTKPTALPLDVIINIIFGLVMALLGLVTIYQAARFAAIHVRRRCTLFLSRPPCTFLKLLTQAGGPQLPSTTTTTSRTSRYRASPMWTSSPLPTPTLRP